MHPLPAHRGQGRPLTGRARVAGGLAALALTLGAAGCGSTSAPKSDAQIAGQELAAGLAAQTAGDMTAAAGHYRNVLAHDPGNKYAYYNLGLIDQQAGRTDTAVSEYRRALASDPAFAEALYNLAILRTSVAPQEALDLYQKTIAAKPDWGAAHLNLGFLYLSMGQKDQAKAEFAKAVALDPSLKSRLPSPAP